ncbi:MAG: saccharopine dehydrogenase NADP-binding domain-containing protein [Synergistaceae bacterium]|nr:saccharopine dehydrogenase NADP-binding domain-containing protein [Synergistaceae bacterium]MDD3964317.1 saccharopine dehydrogenase NADP-binding domain-containing protein [Synergistaceae bacterium]
MGGFTVLQLGYGMQGKASLEDILENKSITKVMVADISDEIWALPEKLKDQRVEPVKLDMRDENSVLELMRKSDVIIELLPGEYALPAAKLAAEAGVSLVSAMYLFNPGEQDETKKELQREEISRLNETAKSKGITILEEFGMDPGIDLVLGAKAVEELDEVKVFHSYGAGFPELEASSNPIRYKFTWSVIGVMRSYLRPARVIKGGKIVDIPADCMFEEDNMHFLKLPEFDSKLECFANGDSVTFSEIFRLDKTISSMGRYICRWPGTGAFWSVMAKSGFLSSTPIMTTSGEIAPASFCAALLGGQEQFRYSEDERDVALIRSDVRGYKNGEPLRVVLQIIDKRDLKSGLTAMQRTVGFPMSIGAQMILDGRISQRGIVNPVSVPFEPFIEELEKRGIVYSSITEKWNGDERP